MAKWVYCSFLVILALVSVTGSVRKAESHSKNLKDLLNGETGENSSPGFIHNSSWFGTAKINGTSLQKPLVRDLLLTNTLARTGYFLSTGAIMDMSLNIAACSNPFVNENGETRYWIAAYDLQRSTLPLGLLIDAQFNVYQEYQNFPGNIDGHFFVRSQSEDNVIFYTESQMILVDQILSEDEGSGTQTFMDWMSDESFRGIAPLQNGSYGMLAHMEGTYVYGEFDVSSKTQPDLFSVPGAFAMTQLQQSGTEIFLASFKNGTVSVHLPKIMDQRASFQTGTFLLDNSTQAAGSVGCDGIVLLFGNQIIKLDNSLQPLWSKRYLLQTTANVNIQCEDSTNAIILIFEYDGNSSLGILKLSGDGLHNIGNEDTFIEVVDIPVTRGTIETSTVDPYIQGSDSPFGEREYSVDTEQTIDRVMFSPTPQGYLKNALGVDEETTNVDVGEYSMN